MADYTLGVTGKGKNITTALTFTDPRLQLPVISHRLGTELGVSSRVTGLSISLRGDWSGARGTMDRVIAAAIAP